MTQAGKTRSRTRRRRGRGARRCAGGAPPKPFDERDIINNGADDDGSGSTAQLAIAKAFATGPKPKRSVVFVWHTGEESGLYGSRDNADFPVVPLEKVQAQLNMDMVGRDDCDNLEGDYRNSVFVVGADRISTDLHNLIVETNTARTKPLTLDYELNDPSGPRERLHAQRSLQLRGQGHSDRLLHDRPASRLSPVTDTVDKILFPKMARIAQLVYESGFSIANTDRALERDNKGPRAGFGAKAEVLKK